MPTSQQLRLKDLRSLYQLLGECCDLGADPLAWRRHLTEQLPVLCGGQLGMYWETVVVAEPFDQPFWLAPNVLIDHGWPTASDRRPFEEHLAGGRPEEGPHITPDLLQRPLRIVHWSGDFGRHGWLDSDYFRAYVKKAHLDDGIFAHHLMDSGEMRWLFVIRALGDRPFNRRDGRLMRVLNLELARLLGNKLSRLGGPSVTDLSPRTRQVLVCLMDGDSEKQAARRLGLSRHTVHDYVKQLHARFGVRSRAELLSHCRAFLPALERLEAANGDGDMEQSTAMVRIDHSRVEVR